MVSEEVKSRCSTGAANVQIHENCVCENGSNAQGMIQSKCGLGSTGAQSYGNCKTGAGAGTTDSCYAPGSVNRTYFTSCWTGPANILGDSCVSGIMAKGSTGCNTGGSIDTGECNTGGNY